MSERAALCLTVNIHGSSVERRQVEPRLMFGRNSYGRYGFNAGHERLLDLFRRLGLKATFFVPATDARDDPGLIEALLRDGHEIAAHGWEMEDHAALAGDAEAELLDRAHEALTRLTGTAPRGWRAPGGTMSADTLRHLAALGYRYDSSFEDDDQPYDLEADGGAGMVELPRNENLTDAVFYQLRQTHDRVLKHWTEEFDAAADEGCFMTLTLHGRSDYGSGRAARVAVVERFLDHAAARGVPIRRCIDVVDDL